MLPRCRVSHSPRSFSRSKARRCSSECVSWCCCFSLLSLLSAAACTLFASSSIVESFARSACSWARSAASPCALASASRVANVNEVMVALSCWASSTATEARCLWCSTSSRLACSSACSDKSVECCSSESSLRCCSRPCSAVTSASSSATFPARLLHASKFELHRARLSCALSKSDRRRWVSNSHRCSSARASSFPWDSFRLLSSNVARLARSASVVWLRRSMASLWRWASLRARSRSIEASLKATCKEAKAVSIFSARVVAAFSLAETRASSAAAASCEAPR
mmetsp:Transcript_7355/g.16851  ORF Transcript_7355/g.16851 Transcript_7355/m.16851 type:complete len:283 (+) Transcript_7355:1090-1938(+)